MRTCEFSIVCAGVRKAESHVHDRPVALRAHREAASLEHIQHGDIFREDLGDEPWSPASRPRIAIWRINAEPMPRP